MSYVASASLSAAHQLLKQWDCLHSQPEAVSYTEVRDALRAVAAHSDNQILGICAGSLAEGQQALLAYAQALGYSVDVTTLEQPGENTTEPRSVYIKYNPKSGLCYADDYSGAHRGVLVSCQSAYESGINEMFGHLPLDLFSEDPPGAIPEAASDNGSK